MVCIVPLRQTNHRFAFVCCLGLVVQNVMLNHWFSFMLSVVVCLAANRTVGPVIDPAFTLYMLLQNVIDPVAGSYFLRAIEKRH